jgi:hypothetical protein
MTEKPLRIRLDLSFESPIVFKGFLPREQINNLHFTLHDKRFEVRLFLSDPEKQLEMLQVPETITNEMHLPCKGLTVELADYNPPASILQALEQGNYNEFTEAYGKELYELVVTIHNRIVDYFGNQQRQYWLSSIRSDPEMFDSHLSTMEARWQDSVGEWRKLRVTGRAVLSFKLSILGNGLSVDQIETLSNFLENKRQLPIWDVLLANAQRHLSEEEGRIAIVEAVAALEAAIKRLLPKLILSRLGTREIEEKHLEKFIQGAGLRSTAEVLLKLLARSEKEIELVRWFSVLSKYEMRLFTKVEGLYR